MKKLFILILMLVILASCNRRETMVIPVGSHIRIQAYNTHDLPLMIGDTVILAKYIGGINSGKYFIENEFILKDSWAKYDTAYGYYGREYYKAVVF